MAYQESLCPGCGRPKNETFDPATDDKYDVTVLVCHACATIGNTSWNRSQARNHDEPPGFGEHYTLTLFGEEAETDD